MAYIKSIKSRSAIEDDQDLKRENDELKAALQSLQKVISGLCQELNVVRSQSQMSDRGVMQKFNEAKICIEDLKSNLSAKMLEKSEDEDKLKKLSEELEATKGRIQQLENEKNIVKGQNEKLLRAAQTVRIKFDELVDVSFTIREENAEHLNRIRSLEGEIVLLKERMANDQRSFKAQIELNDSDCNNLRRETLQLIKEKLYLEDEITKLRNGEASNCDISNNNCLSFPSSSKPRNGLEHSPQYVVDGAPVGTLNNSCNSNHLIKQNSEPAFSRQQEGFDENENRQTSIPPTSSSLATPQTDRLRCSFCHQVYSSTDELLKHGTYCNY